MPRAVRQSLDVSVLIRPVNNPADERSGASYRGWTNLMMTVPAVPSTMPAVPMPAAVISAVISVAPIWAVVASISVVAWIVAVSVAGIVIAAVRIAATKRENDLSVSGARRAKEERATREQNEKRFHASEYTTSCSIELFIACNKPAQNERLRWKGFRLTIFSCQQEKTISRASRNP
jgi:hypothetical protein